MNWSFKENYGDNVYAHEEYDDLIMIVRIFIMIMVILFMTVMFTIVMIFVFYRKLKETGVKGVKFFDELEIEEWVLPVLFYRTKYFSMKCF